MQTQYDYIFLGGGLAGLSLALRLTQDPFFAEKSICIIEADPKTANDRTWCFWEKHPDIFEDVISHHWPQIQFKSDLISKEIGIAPYRYKNIEGASFYAFAKAKLEAFPQFTWLQEKVIGYADEGNQVIVKTEKQRLTASKVLNSILWPELLKKQRKEQWLNQHFIGWFIKTKSPQFNAELATFMDFTVPQKGNCRFMYILPTSTTTALFEYTLFSKDLLEESEYETAITDYLTQIGITEYEIERKEQGCIPMTSYRFDKNNSKNLLHIGTAGGWTKASTGFTFKNSMKKSTDVVTFLKKNDDFRSFAKRDRFWYYDLWFLDVLCRKNELGATLFSAMFKNNPVDRIFKFLDEETSFSEDLKIMWSLPKKEFIKAVFSRMFR